MSFLSKMYFIGFVFVSLAIASLFLFGEDTLQDEQGILRLKPLIHKKVSPEFTYGEIQALVDYNKGVDLQNKLLGIPYGTK